LDRELLLEIGLEEVPASWLPGLTAQLAEKVKGHLAGLGFPLKTPVEAHGTPRRLMACVAELVDRQEDREELIMGPPVSASFDAEGHPTPAALGFARKLNADFDWLQQTDTPKGKYLSYLKKLRGRATVDVLPEVLGAVLRDLSFPKAMHWDAQLEDGKGEFLFGRPIRWLLYLYGGRVVPFTIARTPGASSPRVQDVTSGAVTYGHRFLATSGRAGRAIKVRSFDEYRKKLAENFVLLARSDRRDRIVRDLEAQGRRLGGRAMLHQHTAAGTLIEEVPDLVEFPAVVAGAFSPEFLKLPEEVLTTTLIHHQHFFPVIATSGALMPAFLAVTNTQAGNDRGIATNAERVVAARLRDARFFWDADRAVGLEGRLERLETLVFHKQLGSYRQKADRIEALARWIAADVLGRAEAADAAARAAKLAKCDLATDMVREFTELQGKMGGIYAREAGEPEAVWKAIYHQYLPIAVEEAAAPTPESLGQAAIAWAAVSLADKLDTIAGLFVAGERPTGSRDPFGLRRAANGVIRILVDLPKLTGVSVRPTMKDLLDKAFAGYGKTLENWSSDADAVAGFASFWRERQEYVLETRGFDRRSVRAVTGADVRPADLVENLRTLAQYSSRPDFVVLATLFKRVTNIASELPGDQKLSAASDPLAHLKEPAELSLLAEFTKREPILRKPYETGKGWLEAYQAAAELGPFVSKMFDEVRIMADDETLRRERLVLMYRLSSAIKRLADISELIVVES
jgi:glycyl-tRNA synthetase beta chain